MWMQPIVGGMLPVVVLAYIAEVVKMEQQNIGDNISRYRKEISLSQEKIAEYM